MPAVGRNVQHWLERTFEVPVAEQRNAALALVYIFFAASACVVGRTVADTLFLTRVGSDRLAWMYLVSALVVVAAATIYARLARGVSLRALVIATHLTLAAGAIALRWLLPAHHHDVNVIAPIYLLSEIQGAMTAILFATVLNEVFKRESARGVFGIAGVGSTLAGVVFGTLMAFESADLHAANLLYVMATLQLTTLASFAVLRPGRGGARVARAEGLPTADRPSGGEAVAEPGAVPVTEPKARAYEKWLVVLALVRFPAIMLVGYQWKVTVNDTYHLSEDSMAAYFGAYYAIANSVTLALQVGFAGRLLQRRDLLPALVMFPVAVVLSAATILVSSGGRVLLWAATLSKGSEVLRRSFGDPASQLLYRPLPQAMRRRVIAAIGGGVKPVAEALGALAIVEMTYLSGARDISYLVAALAVVWIAVAWRCRQLYLRAVPSDELGGAT